jgi:hypothetical protein
LFAREKLVLDSVSFQTTDLSAEKMLYPGERRHNLEILRSGMKMAQLEVGGGGFDY